MGNKMTETTPWSDCPLDIFSLGETEWAFKLYLPSFRRPFTEEGPLQYVPIAHKSTRWQLNPLARV